MASHFSLEWNVGDEKVNDGGHSLNSICCSYQRVLDCVVLTSAWGTSKRGLRLCSSGELRREVSLLG